MSKLNEFKTTDINDSSFLAMNPEQLLPTFNIMLSMYSKMLISNSK